MSESKKPLDRQVTEWLEKQGYPLEMHVAQAFNRAGFRVGASSYFKDFETGESREIDILAHRLIFAGEVAVQFSCYIECKQSRDKPWVMFRYHEQDNRFGDKSIISSRVMQELLSRATQNSADFRRLKALPMFQYKQLAFGVTRALTDGKDVAYEAVMQAVKACVARSTALDEYLLGEKALRTCGVNFPVVVIDGRLFDCFLTESGEVAVSEIEAGVLHWKTPNPYDAFPFVHVVTKPALGSFIEQVEKTGMGLHALINDYVPMLTEAIDRIRNKRSTWP